MAEHSLMNLAALQQRDPYITSIIDTAVQVTLYKFSQQRNQWSVTDIEGSLFVYQRSANPTYGLMILNRKDLNNLVQPLTNQVEFHLNTPFLLYKKLADDLEDSIHGIWFVDRGECLRLTETIQKILREVSGRSGDKRPETEGIQFALGPIETKSNMPGQNILSLLSNAHNKYKVIVKGGKQTETESIQLAVAQTVGIQFAVGPVESKSNMPGQYILSLLSNAQHKYEKEHGASQDSGEPKPIQHPSGDASGGSMSHITLDDLFRTVNQHQAKAGLVDTSTETSRSTLMARSLSVTEVEAQSRQQKAPVPAPAEDAIHPILKMISSKTVEEIERQHLEEHKRIKGGELTPEVSPTVGIPSRSPAVPSESSAPIDLMQLLAQGGAKPPPRVPITEIQSNREDLSDNDSTAAVKKLIKLQDPHFGTNRSFVPVCLPSSAQSVDELEQSMTSMAMMPTPPDSTESVSSPSLLGLEPRSRKESTSAGSNASFPILLKPSDLDPSLAKPKSPIAGPVLFNPSVNALLTPQAFSSGTDPVQDLLAAMSTPATAPLSTIMSGALQMSSQDSASTLAPLTKEQLQQALVHLIKTDTNFINTVHAAYLESFHAATGNKS